MAIAHNSDFAPFTVTVLARSAQSVLLGIGGLKRR
jgi:hypothetical protein